MPTRQNIFKLKRSNISGKVPTISGLTVGELAINTQDGFLYTSIADSGGTTTVGIRQIGWDRLSTISGGTVNGPVIFNSGITVNSSIRYTNSPINGYVLTSDINGYGNWAPTQSQTIGGDPGRIYFLAPSVPSDIVGYSLATLSPTLGTGTTITNTNSGTGDNLIGTFATVVGQPGITELPVGIALRVIHGNVANTPEIARYKLDLYSRTTGGTETLLRSGYSDPFGNTEINEIFFTFVALSAVTLNITDRLVFRLYTARVSGPATITVSTYFEQQNPSYIRTTIVDNMDTYVTGFTYNNGNILTISQNQGKLPLSVTINNFTGLTVNGLLSATTIQTSTIKIDGPTTAGYVLTTDVNGFGTWQSTTGNTTTSQYRTTILTAGTVYNFTNFKLINTLSINKAVGSATLVNLNPTPNINDFYIVKDRKGDTLLNPITISGGTYMIDGNSSVQLKIKNNPSLTFLFDGEEYIII